VIGPNGRRQTLAVQLHLRLLPALRRHHPFGGEDISRAANAGAGEESGWRAPSRTSRCSRHDRARQHQASAATPTCTPACSTRCGTFWRARREELELRAESSGAVLDFLEMEHIRDHPVASLSYGLRKRVELARALAMRPRVLMLDEPVAGMNREETEDMARFILDVKEEWGVTILMVEHDMGLVMDISDHVVVLNFGQVIAAGRPAEIQNNPEVIAAYLGAGDVGELSRRIAGGKAA